MENQPARLPIQVPAALHRRLSAVAASINVNRAHRGLRPVTLGRAIEEALFMSGIERKLGLSKPPSPSKLERKK
jgi:hypothetical protein